jgi:hypothetical protein
MATKATTTKGVMLKRGDGGGTEVFTTIAEITNLSGPAETVEQLDATSFDSTAKEYVAALADSGEVTFTMNLVGENAQQQGLRTDLRAGTLRNFKLVIKDRPLEANCTTCSFSALVTELSPDFGGVDSLISQSCTLKVSGQPTWAYAVAA